MARARNIKPGFFYNDILSEVEPLGRLLFIGLWTLADREGRLEDRPVKIKILLLPYDDCNTEKLLQDLHNAGFIIRYSVNENKYIQVVNFIKHQNPHHKEGASVIPPPPGHILKGGAPDTSTKEQRQRVFDRDNHKCVYCGTFHNLTIDHIIPLIKGGSSDDDNLQTLCKSCNYSKKDSTLNQDSPKHEPSRKTQASTSPADSPSLIPDSGFPLIDSSNDHNDDDNARAQEIKIPVNEDGHVGDVFVQQAGGKNVFRQYSDRIKPKPAEREPPEIDSLG